MLSLVGCFFAWSIILISALALLVVCSVTPRLLNVVCNNESQDFAVWYARVCANNNCDTVTYWNGDIASYHFRRGDSQIFETQLTVTAALVLCLASLFLQIRLSLRHKRGSNEHPPCQLQGTVYVYYVLAVFLCGSATLIAIPLISLIRTNVSLHTIFSAHDQHSCRVTVPYGLIALILGEFFTLTAAVFACLFAYKVSRTPSLANGTCVEGQGQQMASLVVNEENGSHGYTDPVKPGYNTPLMTYNKTDQC